jgi:enoyl-CoA hydratase/carnithine racemase
MSETSFKVEALQDICVIHLQSEDGTNRLTRNSVMSLTEALRDLAPRCRGLIVAGNNRFFSTGAELEEVSALTGPTAFEFAKQGQALMNTIQNCTVPVYAAISGYCMGGGLDLAISCRRRIAALNAVFGHRGAALGLITGWGGTQRLPRLIGKGRALAMFIAAEQVHALQALEMGLVDAIAEDPVAEAVLRIRGS